ncbi:MAG: hypothetical protein ACKOT0_13425 [bacterium]
MADPRTLVRVPARDLPPQARALLDPGLPRPESARYLARRSRAVWIPLAWLIGLLVVGLAGLRMTLAAGLDPATGDGRVGYAALTAASLVGALFAGGKLIQGMSERRDVASGAYRQGLHVLGRDGLLVAGRHVHTWVPRDKMPAAMQLSDRGGGSHVARFAFVIVDDAQRMERLDCGIATTTALRSWAERGVLPEGDGWR